MLVTCLQAGVARCVAQTKGGRGGRRGDGCVPMSAYVDAELAWLESSNDDCDAKRRNELFWMWAEMSVHLVCRQGLKTKNTCGYGMNEMKRIQDRKSRDWRARTIMSDPRTF